MSCISSIDRCAICLDPLDEDLWSHDKHRFHGRCVKLWLREHPTCPTCRATVDTTSLLGHKVLLSNEEMDEESDDDLDDFPKQMIHSYLGFMIFAASLPVYDVVVTGNPIVIGAIASLGVGIIIRRIT